jgi:L-lysine 2,3-aminomutase
MSKHLEELTTRAGLSADERLAVRAVATVLPFRVNAYVVDELIDWDAAPDDPIYRLTFPQADMLPPDDLATIADLIRKDVSKFELNVAANKVRARLNPHPAGQLELNLPKVGDEPLNGVQHKYAETVLFFPKQGQTCHAYCMYCFRWAQFIGEPDLKMANDDIGNLINYLREHPEVTSVLFTGGDPMIMGEGVLNRYLEPLLEIDQLESIRIGTKAMAYWPQRWVTDPDADDTLRLFERVVASGKNLAFMAHFSHPHQTSRTRQCAESAALVR